MKGLEMLDKLRAVIEMSNEPVSASFTYAMLNEMARMVEYEEKYQSLSHDIIIQSYLYIADEYMYQRHFLYAKQYYGKVLALSENCPGFALKDGLIEWCCKQLVQIDSKEDGGSTKYDPVEHTEQYLKILIELEAKIEEELRGEPMGEGFCFMYWHKKEEILKRDYGIDWDSPAVLNPGTRFD